MGHEARNGRCLVTSPAKGGGAMLSEVSRDYLRGCPRDRRSINRHSQRIYATPHGNRFLLDRTLDALPVCFTLYALPVDGHGLAHEIASPIVLKTWKAAKGWAEACVTHYIAGREARNG